MKITPNIRTKILSILIAVLVFSIQVLPKEESNGFGDHRLPEWNIDNNILNISFSGSKTTQNIVRHNSLKNLSPAYRYCDKHDILSFPILIDSKKIYGGGFSFLHNYSKFLTVLFSTYT